LREPNEIWEPDALTVNALQIAIATVNAVQFIVTWKFKHILKPQQHAIVATLCDQESKKPGGAARVPLMCRFPAYWHEQDPDYRQPLLAALTTG